MFVSKLKKVAETVGLACFVFLALYGALMLARGDMARAAGSATEATPVPVEAPQAVSLNAPLLDGWDGATVPLVTNYQGVLKDAEGNLLSGYYTMTFRIYDDVTALITDTLWSKQHISVTVRDGRFNVLLGNNESLSVTLFTDPDRFIGVTVAPYDEMVPRQRFASVPYAMHADNASRLSAPDGDPMDAATVNNDGTLLTSDIEIVRDGWAVLDIRSRDHDAHIRLFDEDDYWSIHNDDSEGNKFDIRYNNGSKAVITADGNVGIGTTSPNDKLDVAGTLDVSGRAYLNGITLDNDADITGADQIIGYGDLRLYGDNSGGPDLYIGTNGYVGIGKTTPSQKLDVYGNIAWSGDLVSMQILGPYRADVDIGDPFEDQTQSMTSVSNSICFLTKAVYQVGEGHSGIHFGCGIGASAGKWTLNAHAHDDRGADCEARCLQW